MANKEIHASSEDELSAFARSLVEKIVENEKLKAKDASKLRRERMGFVGRVPDVVREQNGSAYSPTTVSIGPLHRGKEHLQDMEHVKLSYTHALLERVDKANLEKTMKDCAAAMLEMEEDVWNSYDPPTLPPNTQENVRWLSEVILIDACFILQLISRYDEKTQKRYRDEDDPISRNSWAAINRDLVSLENQIPFSVLQELFKWTVEKIPYVSKQSLTELVMTFFHFPINLFPINCEIWKCGTESQIDEEKIRTESRTSRERNEETKNSYHILHLLHIYLQSLQSNIEVEVEAMERRMKYSATGLLLAGVELEQCDFSEFNIKFTTSFSFISCWSMFRKGHLEIPRFIITDSSASFLRNLVALEQSCPSIGSHFTSFAFLMHHLIDTAEDVKLLEKARIISNYSDEDVARLFNGICSNATAASGSHYCKQYKEAIDFSNRPWRVSTRKLRQDYFGNPWTGISVIAAIIPFFLTFISTLYTMLSYYH